MSEHPRLRTDNIFGVQPHFYDGPRTSFVSDSVFDMQQKSLFDHSWQSFVRLGYRRVVQNPEDFSPRADHPDSGVSSRIVIRDFPFVELQQLPTLAH
jgi:hypothetical protein